MNADNLVYDIMAAFYTVCGTFMGQNLGARNKDRVIKSYLISLLYSTLIAVIAGLLLVIFGHQFLGLFANEKDVIAAGMDRLVIMGLCYWLSAPMDCTTAATRALGKTVIPTIIMILGILIPIVVAVFANSNHELMIISISACMAGAVCGDHCSPISDTTIMASAGAQCKHINHVNTQLPYAIIVAVISFITYIIAGFAQSALISLPIGIVLMLGTLFVIKKLSSGKNVSQ